ncbi:MAG TPA: DUF4185 domain-containing protein [Polyangia bacterium]|nr:DUF4185 domain-containing protein [Polyangia bacterium]
MRALLFASLLAAAACSRPAVHPRADASADGSSDLGSGSALDAGDGSGDGGNVPANQPDGATSPLPLPAFQKLEELCKLISNQNLDDPSGNDTHHRFNLRGTDLGIPVANGDDVFFFFGDSAGYKAIWPLGPQSLPDAVGYSGVPASTLAATPEALCTNLGFVALAPADSLGPGADPSIARDFAGAAMRAPGGHALGEYIHNPAGDRGADQFPQLPGDFEVPSGGFASGGDLYVFYTTVQVSPLAMKGSYLARWTAPSKTGLPSYDILYGVDERFDAAGALGGNFINVAALVEGDYVYLYGTGDYRASAVQLARKRLSELSTPGGFERYDAATKMWYPASAASMAPVVASSSIGELSVRHWPAIGRFVMMNQEITNGRNLVVARFAEAPEGPWSDPVVVAEMGDPAFAAKYCCVNDVCDGAELFNCDRAGFYGTYMLPDVAAHADGSFSVSFMMSTWDPYNVALMRATFR